MKVTLSFEMNEGTAKLFLISALERVINTSMKIVLQSSGDGDINHDDWEEWKPIVVTFWTAMHDAVYRAKQGLPPSPTIFTLTKGDL